MIERWLKNLGMHSFIGIVLGLMVFLTVQCSKNKPKEPIVATVGNRTISLTSFERAYLPVILYGDKFDSPETRKQTLDYLIGDKILAQEAEKVHLDTVPILDHIRRVAEHKAMARHLYNEWVRSKISEPSEAELRQAFERSNKQLFVRHLFAPTEEAADSLYAILQSGTISFEELASRLFRDSTLSADGGALGWLNWGDLDETLEDSAYSAPIGKYTHPVHSQYGWHILRVDDFKKQMIVTEVDYQQKKAALARRIYERREAVVGKQILNDFMHEQHVAFNREVSRPVFNAIIKRRAPKEGIGPEEQDRSREREFATLSDELAPYLDQNIVTFAGESWTVLEFLDRLPEMDRKHFYGNLYVGLANLVRDELLGREGYAKGYNKSQDVIEEVQDRQDKLLAQLYLQTLWDTLTITDKMVDEFYQENWRTRYHAPDSLRLQEILVQRKALADTLMFRLRGGADFDEFAQRFTERKGFRQVAGDLGWQVDGVTPYKELYQQAMKVKTGIPTGPIQTIAGWSIVRVTERHHYPKPLSAIRDKVRQDMQNYRQSVVREQALEKARRDVEVERHDEVLNMIDQEQ